MGRECVFCGYSFSSAELVDINFLLEHTAKCVSAVSEQEDRKGFTLCSACYASNQTREDGRDKKKRHKSNQLSAPSDAFEQGFSIIGSYVTGKDILSFALVNKKAFQLIKPAIEGSLWFNLAKAKKDFECYRPTQCIAVFPSQLFNGITKLQLLNNEPQTMESVTITNKFTFPPTLTLLDLSQFDDDIKLTWPPCIHTLILKRCDRVHLPEGLQVLKVTKECNRIEYLPSSLTELDATGQTLTPDEIDPLHPSLQIFNFHYLIPEDHPPSVFPPSLKYIKSLQIQDGIPIPRAIQIDELNITTSRDDIPASVTQLSILDAREALPLLPPLLNHLKISGQESIPIPPLPSTLTSLSILMPCKITHPFPSTLTTLIIGHRLRTPRITDFPSLTSLECEFAQADNALLPSSLTSLRLRDAAATDEEEVGRGYCVSHLRVGNLSIEIDYA